MKKILVIDDDEGSRRMTAMMLSKSGYDVTEAANGRSGLNLAREQLPDLVLSDVNMEGLDGYDFLQQLRSLPATSSIPVILMTGAPDEQTVRHGMVLGADDYLAKPLEVQSLLETIRVRLERQQTIQRRAKEQEQLLLEILSATESLVAVISAGTSRLTYLNQAGRRMLGIRDDEDITGLRLGDFQAPGEIDEPNGGLAPNNQTQITWTGESAFLSRDGRRVPVSKQVLAHYSPGGWVSHLSIIASDISERKQMEAALRDSENRHRELINSLGEGIVFSDADLNLTFANPAAGEIFGLSAKDLVGRNIREFLSESEASKAVLERQVLLRKQGQQSTYELEIVPIGGGARQLLVTATPRIYSDRYQGTFAVFRDITERKQADQQLRLQTSALEAAANSIVITDRAGHMLWINSAFTRLTGYSMAEVVGKTPALLKSGKHDRTYYARLWDTITRGDTWHGELINRRKDGSLYHEEMTIAPVRGADGEIANFIAVKQEISDRKKFEEELARERDLLQALMNNLPDYIYFKDASCRFTRTNLAHARHLGLRNPEEAIGKTDIDFGSVRQARQNLVDERRLLATGEPILGLVEGLEVAGKKMWVSSTKVPLRDAAGQIMGLVGISRDITGYKLAELERLAMQGRYQLLFDSAGDAILTLGDGKFQDCNRAALRMFRCHEKTQVTGASLEEFSPPHQPDGTESRVAAGKHVAEALKSGTKRFEWTYRRRDGEDFPAEVSLTSFWLDDRQVVQATVRDLTERKQAEKERQMMELQLRQSQKLESIGQLAAGIAHEINTPTQYVGDNTRFLKDAFANILGVLNSHGELLAAARQNAITPELLEKDEALLAASDLEYFCVQIPQAIQETLEGIERVTKIVRAMKEFSHPGGQEKCPADLNKAIESTVTVARNEWKYVADLTTDFEPGLPFVPCFLGEFNQVILNLVVNAAHAIGDVVKKHPGTKGRIVVQTRRDGDHVIVRVSDTGTGIPESHRSHIFEPFFTTKEVGKGSGQGLALVYNSIIKKHGGTVAFETETGVGTTFIIRLPVTPPAVVPEKPATPSPISPGV